MAHRILIVDDDPDIVDAVTLVLESKGYEVLKALDGEEGLRIAKEEHPDLILLDIMMVTPDQGFHVAYALKGDPDLARIPVVVVTSVGQKTRFSFDKEKDGDFIPVEEYLEKPIKPAVLIATVEKYLRYCLSESTHVSCHPSGLRA